MMYIESRLEWWSEEVVVEEATEKGMEGFIRQVLGTKSCDEIDS